MPTWTDADERFMRRALDLALRGQGFVEPNPMVGCVLVKSGKFVGQGYHQRFGGPHAEPNAIRAAGRRAAGSTAYVTLEPCGHFGKTPPCTDALTSAGIKRVVVAMRDPNPLVAGKGLKTLRAAGIQVDVGLLRREAALLNAPFITFHTEHRPYVILKWAQSLDGKIATRTGDSKWISSPPSRALAHALRARVDAVLVGVGTVLADDPELTARLAPPKRLAARVVLDSRLRIPLRCRLVRTAREVPTLIVATPWSAPTRPKQPGASSQAAANAGAVSSRRVSQCAADPGRGRPGSLGLARDWRTGNGTSGRQHVQTQSAWEQKVGRLRRAGCDVLILPSGQHGVCLRALLGELHRRQMTNILVEGGGRVLGSFVSEDLADEAQIVVAPVLIGGSVAPGPLNCVGPAAIRDIPNIKVRSMEQVGRDLWYNVHFV